MKIIYKYPIEIGQFTLELPKNAQILTVQIQFNKPVMWVLIDKDEDLEMREFYVLPTGISTDIPNLKYIQTFQLDEGQFIGHLFEIQSFSQVIRENMKFF